MDNTTKTLPLPFINSFPLLLSSWLPLLSLSFPETHNCCVYKLPSLSIVNTPFAASPMMVTLAPTFTVSILADALKSLFVQVLDNPLQVAIEK